MTTHKITVFLSEDHLIVRKGLKALIELEKDMVVVGEAENGFDAVKMVSELTPMIVVMDVALPKLNGIEASRKILKDFPSTKILILSAYADDGYIEKVISIGVSGFLIKQCSPNILIEAIREISKGNVFFSPSISDRLQHLNGFSKKRSPLLSGREVEVLQLIAEGKANKEIAFELGISIKTIEKHRQGLMKKLSIHDVAGLTRYAITEGIIECNGTKKT